MIGGSLGELKIIKCPGRRILYQTYLNGDIATIVAGDIDNDGKIETILATTSQAGEIRIWKTHSRKHE